MLCVQNIVSCCACYTGETSFEPETEADSNDVSAHSEDDKPRPHVCTVCDKRFIQEENLNAHKLVHSGERLYSCTQCGKRFSTKSGLWRHKNKNVHTSEYKCTECGKCVEMVIT